jgi:hypothetical protein
LSRDFNWISKNIKNRSKDKKKNKLCILNNIYCVLYFIKISTLFHFYC